TGHSTRSAVLRQSRSIRIIITRYLRPRLRESINRRTPGQPGPRFLQCSWVKTLSSIRTIPAESSPRAVISEVLAREYIGQPTAVRHGHFSEVGYPLLRENPCSR